MRKHRGEIMILFKSCPRCSGDRVLEKDMYGQYISCLACGHVAYPEERRELTQAARAARRTGW